MTKNINVAPAETAPAVIPTADDLKIPTAEDLKKEKAALAYLDGMTNLDNDSFTFVVDGKRYNVVNAAAAPITSAQVILYRLDLKAGTCKDVAIDGDLKGVNPMPFAVDMAKYWYKMVLADVRAVKAKVFDVLSYDSLNDDHKLRFDVLQARYDDAQDICRNAGDNGCTAAKNMILAIYGGKAKSYGIDAGKAIDELVDVLQSIFNRFASGESNVKTINIKALRVAVDNAKRVLMPNEPGSACTQMSYRCSDAQIRNILASYIKGYEYNRHTAKVNLVLAGKKDIIKQVVFDCVFAAQAAPIAPETAPAEMPHKPTAPANKGKGKGKGKGKTAPAETAPAAVE